MNKAIKVLMAAALAATMSGAAMASHICAYVNDNVLGTNDTEGYKIGPGMATSHVGPYMTNGNGNGYDSLGGGLIATRAQNDDLYVDDTGNNNITHFTINNRNCKLTLDTTLYPSGDKALDGAGDPLAITPDGNTMFVGSSGDDHIYSHTIAANGSLGPTFTETTTSEGPDGMGMSPDGKTLVVGLPLSHQVCAYPISNGHLGGPNCQTEMGSPTGIAIDPASACVYAGEFNKNTSEVAAFTLTAGILGTPTDYSPFGPGVNASGVLVNYDNAAIYISNAYSAELTTGLIAPGCRLTYQTILHVAGNNNFPGQIAQASMPHAYVVLGDDNQGEKGPTMGVFHAYANGKLTRIGKLPLMLNTVPATVAVIGFN
jgi:hypothetical protein